MKKGDFSYELLRAAAKVVNFNHINS